MTVINRKKLFHNGHLESALMAQPTNVQTTTDNSAESSTSDEPAASSVVQITSVDVQTSMNNMPINYIGTTTRTSSSFMSSPMQSLPSTSSGHTPLTNEGSGYHCNLYHELIKNKIMELIRSSRFSKKIRGGHGNGIAVYSLPLRIIVEKLRAYNFSISHDMLWGLIESVPNIVAASQLPITVYCFVDVKTVKLIGIYFIIPEHPNLQLMDNQGTSLN